jgi:hypothetical protein
MSLMMYVNVEFDVIDDATNEYVGKISKQWPGLPREFFPDDENFGVSFPGSIPPQHKACLLGAAILIYFMFF